MSEQIKTAENGERTIKALENKISKLKSEALEMEFQVSAAMEMARMQITSDIASSFVAHTGKIDKAQVSKAMGVAELILDNYKTIVDERKVEYRGKVEELQMERATNEALGVEN